MTRSELVAAIAQRQPQLPVMDADLAVRTLIEAMSEALAEGRRIEVRGFGSFSLRYRPPRLARNPKSGTEVPVAAKYVPHFKAGKRLRETVQEGAREQANPPKAAVGLGS